MDFLESIIMNDNSYEQKWSQMLADKRNSNSMNQCDVQIVEENGAKEKLTEHGVDNLAYVNDE